MTQLQAVAKELDELKEKGVKLEAELEKVKLKLEEQPSDSSLLEDKRNYEKRLLANENRLAALQEEKTVLTKAAQGTANRGGPAGSSAAGISFAPACPKGTIKKNLDRLAPALKTTDSPDIFLLEGEAVTSKLNIYADPGGQAQTALRQHFDYADRAYQPRKDDHTAAMQPLWVTGPTKSGKTLTAGPVARAVIRDHPTFGVGQEREVVVWSFSMADLPVNEGYGAMLRTLLLLQLLWAAQQDLPVPAELWGRATAAVQGRPDKAFLENLILEVLWSHKDIPILAQPDEIQEFVLPRMPDGVTIDQVAAASARAFLKRLMIYGPGNIIWVLTGSSLITFFVSAAMVAVNGWSFLLHSVKLHLPITMEPAVLEHVWHALEKAYGPLPAMLKKLAEANAAHHVYLVTEYDACRPTDVPLFVISHILNKQVAEANKDYTPAMSLLHPDQRVFLADLSDVERGVAASNSGMDPGLWLALRPYLTAVDSDPKRLYLNSAAHRELIQLVVTEGGLLRRLWAGSSTGGNLTYWNVFRTLLRFGNTTVAATAMKWSGPSCANLEQSLKVLAASMEVNLGCSAAQWPEEKWFRWVYWSEYNDRSRPKFDKERPTLQPWQVLLWYIRFLRNCLAHQDWDTEEIQELSAQQPPPRPMAADDVDLLDSCPLAPSLVKIPAVTGSLMNQWRKDRAPTTLSSSVGSSSVGSSGVGSSSSGSYSSTAPPSTAAPAMFWRGQRNIAHTPQPLRSLPKPPPPVWHSAFVAPVPKQTVVVRMLMF